MRTAYAHEALLDYPADADEGSAGAALTVALCGHWEHDPPCPLAPHHTSAVRVDGRLALRILFATEPHRQAEARRRIADALSAGTGPSLHGEPVVWRLISQGPRAVADDEADHAASLAASASSGCST
jgi:hypothetical protein